MKLTTTALTLLASSSFVAAAPQWAHYTSSSPIDPATPCWTSTICTDLYPTRVHVLTKLITSTSVSTHYDPVTITTSTPSPVVVNHYVTHTSETTSTWEVTTQKKIPYVTHRVVTIPVHTYSLEDVCETSSTVLYPINVVTQPCNTTTIVPAYITTSTACYDTLYPVSTSLRTNIITRTVESCYTVTGDGHSATSILTGVTLSSAPASESILTGVTLSSVPASESILTGVTRSSEASILTGVTRSILTDVTRSSDSILTGVTRSSESILTGVTDSFSATPTP